MRDFIAQIPKDRVSILLILFLSTLSLIKLLTINGSNFIQIPELCFLLMLPFCKLSLFKKFTILDIGVLSFGIALALNFFVHSNLNIKYEIFGCGYLIAIYFVNSRLIETQSDMERIIIYGMLGNLIVCIFVAFIGLVLHTSFDNHSFFRYYEAYPYFGDTWRLIGLSTNNIIISCLGMSILFLPSFNINSFLKVGLAIGGLSVCMMTFNKEIVILLPLLALLLFYNRKVEYLSLKVMTLSFVLLASCATFFTFFGVKKSFTSYTTSAIGNLEQVDAEVFFSCWGYDFHGTTYYYIFKNAINAFLDHPLAGIGFEQLSSYIEGTKMLGEYPINMKVYGSHDIYWGPASELGLFYIGFLILSVLAVLKFSQRRKELPIVIYNSIMALVLYFGTGFLISGSIQYRHIWILLAILNFYLLQAPQHRKINLW